MTKTLYERDMEDSLQQIADALGMDVSWTPDVEALIREAKRAGKDAARWRWLREQGGWPDTEAAMMDATPEDFDKMADARRGAA